MAEESDLATIKLLRQCQAQFQYYAQSHLRKAQAATTRDAKQDATRKSDINLHLAEEIDRHLMRIHNETHPLNGMPPHIVSVQRTRPRNG